LMLASLLLYIGSSPHGLSGQRSRSAYSRTPAPGRQNNGQTSVDWLRPIM